MRIVVPVKQVPETNAVRMDEATGTMIREGVEAIVNPLDLYAIELAIRLREQHGGEVTAISMGPPKAESALREALAMGVDSAVLISDRRFAGSDTWCTSYALAAAVRRLGPVDLVVCGERATDGDTGQVGPALAAFLGLPVATYVAAVERVGPGPLSTSVGTMQGDRGSPDGCRVRRLVEDGCEVLDVQLPAVLTVVKAVASPRLPTLRGKQRARRAELPVWTVEDLGLPPERLGLNGSPTRVVRIFRPKVARQCVKLPATDSASTEQAADRVVQYLRQHELI